VTGRRDGKLARLIERSSELKRDLVGFACSPRLRRSLATAMREAGPQVSLAARDAEVRAGLSLATTTMSHCAGQDHDDVTSSRFTRPGWVQI
jgi:hypothetical protein